MYVLIHGIVGKPDKKLINVSDCRSSLPFFPLAERNGIFRPCPCAHAIALALVWRSAHAHYNIYQIEIDVQFFKRLYRFDSFENLSCRKLNFIFLFFLLCSTIFLINFCLSHHKLAVDATLTNKYSFISITYTAVPVLVHHRLSSAGIGHSLPSPLLVLGSELSSDMQWHVYPFESLAKIIWRTCRHFIHPFQFSF